MDISIVIVNWNVRDFLERCLDSIFRNVGELSFEVIVVDNCSRDGSVMMVEERFPSVRIIRNANNAGFCRGNNQGIAISKGDYLLLLNPDTEIEERALEALIDFASEHRDVGVVGPMLLYPKNYSMPNGSRFPTFWSEFLAKSGLADLLVGLLHMRNWYNLRYFGRQSFAGPAYVDFVSGACMLIRREVINQIGGLDERFFMFYDEVDFCLRARRAGWRVYYFPAARVFHNWHGVGRSVSQSQDAAKQRFFLSQYAYFEKHHGVLAALVLRALGILSLSRARYLLDAPRYILSASLAIVRSLRR